jgi:uncharacterized protein (TIGR02145 family)
MPLHSFVTALSAAVLAATLAAQSPAPAARRLADGRTWSTSNLGATHGESYCYGDDEFFCRMYGRLYTWSTARTACQTLGTGWRLPTADEWGRLAQAYGGSSGEDGRFGSASYDALLSGGRSGFDVVLGGGREAGGGYARADAHGFYWTSTESTASTALYMNFGKGSRGLYRQRDGDKGEAFSVRCVQD